MVAPVHTTFEWASLFDLHGLVSTSQLAVVCMGHTCPCSVCLALRHKDAAPLSNFTTLSQVPKRPHCFGAASGPGAAGFGRVFSTAPATSLFGQEAVFATLTPPWVAVPPWSGPGGDGAASAQPSGAPRPTPCLDCRSLQSDGSLTCTSTLLYCQDTAAATYPLLHL